MEGEFKENRGVCMMTPVFDLNNGVSIPAIGMGGWDQKENQVLDSLSTGYRLLDTAAQYGNEGEYGQALSTTDIKREEIFLTTKLWTDDVRSRRTREAFNESLERLKTDYIDLYLIHWPAEGFEEAWLEMEDLYKEKKIRSIGVSNFELHHFECLKKHGATVIPAVNQIEIHPYLSNSEVVDYCLSNGIRPEAWCPIGGPERKEINDDIIKEIAENHGKSAPQIILRWHFQRGVISIPKTSHVERMKENKDIFDFELSPEEMKMINGLDRNRRLGPHPDNFDF